MKKLRLSVESLRVEGFEVLSPEMALEGTVMGRNDASGFPASECLLTHYYRDTCGAGSCPSGYPCKICPNTDP